MWVIYDEKSYNRMMNTIGSRRRRAEPSPGLEILSMATFIAVIKDDGSYEIIKDRGDGEAGPFPLEEFPDDMRQRFVDFLKRRAGVSTDEDETDDEEIK